MRGGGEGRREKGGKRAIGKNQQGDEGNDLFIL